jgi:ATP-dependent RNA helicase RhlE
MFIVDDAAEIVKRGMQLPVAELARSIVKCQHLVFTEVIHDKLHLLIDQFMKQPALIEVNDLGELKLETIDQILYKVPDFKTKVNLLNILLRDKDVFSKSVVFVNTRLTAEKVFKSLFKYLDKDIAIYKPLFFDHPGFDLIDDFKQTDDARILLIADDLKESIQLEGIPFIFHLEIPADIETFVGRIVKSKSNAENEQMAISFSTDIELVLIKKIELAIGKVLPQANLPEDLVIEKDKPKKTVKTTKVSPDTESLIGAAFHPKKESNAKDVILGYKTSLDAQMLDKVEPKQETLEEAAEKLYPKEGEDYTYGDLGLIQQDAFKFGAKWQAERMYNKEDMRKCWDASKRFERPISEGYAPNFNEFIEQFKKK